MLKKVLWIAAACAAILAALAVSRMLDFDKPARKAEPAEVKVETAPAAEAPVPPPPPPPPEELKVAPPPLTPEEQQIQDDAAATGMTTMEPDPTEPPTN